MAEAARQANVLVIGAGPAGISAAAQLQRYGLRPVVFEAGAPGGLLRNANLVENYPGFPDGIRGPALAARMAAHLAELEVRVVRREAEQAGWDGERFWLLAEGERWIAPWLAIASGTEALRLEAPPIPAELESRVFYEVWPLGDAQGLQAAVIGGGDAAFDYALNLARANRVTILNRSRQRRCLDLLYERALACPQIEYRAETRLQALEAGTGGRLRLRLESAGGEARLEADALLIAIGRQPRLGFLDASLRERLAELERRGRLHRIGDVNNGLFRQAAIACGDGLRAAMAIYQCFLGGEK